MIFIRFISVGATEEVDRVSYREGFYGIRGGVQDVSYLFC